MSSLCRNQAVLQLILAVAFCFQGLQPYAYSFAGGSGDRNCPYQISTVEQLVAIGLDPHLVSKNFILIRDLDLSGISFSNALIPRFSGTFDGNNLTIRGMTVRGVDSVDVDNVALFGYVAAEGQVKNLGIEHVDVTGRGRFTAALVARNDGVVVGCYSTGVVSGVDLVGGLIGHNGGHVVGCYSLCTVEGRRVVGGLVGGSGYDLITDSYSQAMVKGQMGVGGLIGASERSRLINCYSMAVVFCSGDFVGGLLGHCYYAIVANCYSMGAVSGGGKFVGGLVGYSNWPTVYGSFWDIDSSGQAQSQGGIGLSTMKMQDIQTYIQAGWDLKGRAVDGLCETWWVPDCGGYPVLSIFQGHQPVRPNGKGTSDEPYLIGNEWELAAVNRDPWAYYRLIRSIDLSGICWSLAVIPDFRGSFDGNGFTIRGLHIAGGPEVGLFGRIDQGAVIRRLYLEDVNIVGDIGVGGLVGNNFSQMGSLIEDCQVSGSVYGRSEVGGLVGNNRGRVVRSRSFGLVTGTDCIGGLVGNQDRASCIEACSSWAIVAGAGLLVGGLVGQNNGTIESSFAAGAVSGVGFVGGLVGYNLASIFNCYSICSVSGTSGPAGGLVGENWEIVACCYSAGPVSAISGLAGGLVGSNHGFVDNCFWDMEASGQLKSQGGLGKSSIEMRQKATFIGWDFEKVWDIVENQTYPFLRMQDLLNASP